jgi:hypothetical protein
MRSECLRELLFFSQRFLKSYSSLQPPHCVDISYAPDNTAAVVCDHLGATDFFNPAQSDEDTAVLTAVNNEDDLFFLPPLDCFASLPLLTCFEIPTTTVCAHLSDMQLVGSSTFS